MQDWFANKCFGSMLACQDTGILNNTERWYSIVSEITRIRRMVVIFRIVLFRYSVKSVGRFYAASASTCKRNSRVGNALDRYFIPW